MSKQGSKFGEWLRIRRIAAELTPVDVAKKIGMEFSAYRDLEAGRGSITPRQVSLLVKIEKMKMSALDVQRHDPPLVATGELDLDELPSEQQDITKAQSALDSLIASVQAKNARDAKPTHVVSPLGAYLIEQAKQTGLSRNDFARRCRLSPMDLDDIERGLVPGPATLRGIAQGLGVDVAELPVEVKA